MGQLTTMCEDDLSVQLLKLLAPEKREPEA
jgi:hypothetical protein